MRIFSSSPVQTTIRFTADFTLTYRQCNFLVKKLSWVLEMTEWQESRLLKVLYAELPANETCEDAFCPSDCRAVMEVVDSLFNMRAMDSKLHYIVNLNTGRDLLIRLKADVPESIVLDRFARIYSTVVRQGATLAEVKQCVSDEVDKLKCESATLQALMTQSLVE